MGFDLGFFLKSHFRDGHPRIREILSGLVEAQGISKYAVLVWSKDIRDQTRLLGHTLIGLTVYRLCAKPTLRLL